MSELCTYIAASYKAHTYTYFRPDSHGNFIQPMIRHCGSSARHEYIYRRYLLIHVAVQKPAVLFVWSATLPTPRSFFNLAN